MRKICILNAGTHGQSQSGQSRSRSWPITQCPIARTWESAPKQCAVMAIVEDRDRRLSRELSWLYLHSKCGIKTKTYFEWLLWHWSSLGQLNLEPTRPNGLVGCKGQLTLWRSVSKKPCTWVFIILWKNKANLRDLIAATGLVILLKFDPNHRFFSPCDLEIWCMTSKNNRAPLLYYIKLCVSFQIHRWIRTEVTLRKRSIRVEIGIFCPLWHWNLMDDLGKR